MNATDRHGMRKEREIRLEKDRERQKKSCVKKKYTFKRRTYYRNNILKKILLSVN